MLFALFSHFSKPLASFRKDYKMLSVKIDMRMVEPLRESFIMFKRDKTEYKPE